MKQIVHLIFVHSSLSIKFNFYYQKPYDPPLAASAQKICHIDKCIAIRYLLKTYCGGFAER